MSFHAAKNPTCTETGHKAYSACTRCDYTTRVEIPALGHNIVAHEAKAPDCTNVGNEAYEACTRCNYTTYVEIPALGHDEVAHEAKAPDCTNVGNEAYVACTRCDYTANYVEIPALGHNGHETDYKCDTCKQVVAPAAGSVLTIEQAITLGQAFAHNTYTTDKYYVTGIITNIYQTTYGNMYIADVNGNELTIYGTYSADGEIRYDAMATKPKVGDIITIYGIVGQYGGTSQIKNGWVDDFYTCEHTLVETKKVDATCTNSGSIIKTCSTCELYSVTEKIAALGHTTENGTCERCGEEITNAPAEPTVYTFDVKSFGSANSSYTKRTSKDGWIATNSALNEATYGGTKAFAVVLNGKKTAAGTLTSATLSDGIQSLSFKYGFPFSDTKFKITINIKQDGEIVASTVLNKSGLSKLTAYDFTWVLETPIEGEFTIEIINNCVSGSTSNKDRLAIWDLSWTSN